MHWGFYQIIETEEIYQKSVKRQLCQCLRMAKSFTLKAITQGTEFLKSRKWQWENKTFDNG